MSKKISYDGTEYSLSYFSQKYLDYLNTFNKHVKDFNTLFSSYIKDGWVNDDQFSKLKIIAEEVYQIYEKGQKLYLREYFFNEFINGNITESLWTEISDTLHKNSANGTTNARTCLGITESKDLNIKLLNRIIARFSDPQVEVIERGVRIPSSRHTSPRLLSSSDLDLNKIKDKAYLHNSTKHDDIQTNSKEDYIEDLFVALEEIGHFVEFYISNGKSVIFPNRIIEEDYVSLSEKVFNSFNGSIFTSIKILITEHLDLDCSSLQTFTGINWDVIVDLDPTSSTTGLEAAYSGTAVTEPTILYTDDHFILKPISSLYWFRLYNRESSIVPSDRQMSGYLNKLLVFLKKYRCEVSGNILLVTNTKLNNNFSKEVAKALCDMVYPTDKDMADYANKSAFVCCSLDGKDCFPDYVSSIYSDRKQQFITYDFSFLDFLSKDTQKISPFVGTLSKVYVDNLKNTKTLSNTAYRCIEIIYADSEIEQERRNEDLEKNSKLFYLAQAPISWYLINSNHTAIISQRLQKCLNTLLENKVLTINGPNYVLPYDPGVGGTTALRIVAYNYSKTMPSVLVKQYTTETYKECKKLFSEVETPLFIGADENDILYEDYVKLCKELSEAHIQHISLYVYRKDGRQFPKKDMVNRLDELIPLDRSQAQLHRDRLVGILKSDDNVKELAKGNRIQQLDDSICDQHNYPFIMSMYIFDKDFKGVPAYINRFLDGKYGLTEKQKDILIWLSIITKYTSISLDVELFSADESFFVGTAKLVSQKVLRFEHNNLTKKHSVKVMHPFFAEEILQQLLMPENNSIQVYFERICTKIQGFIEYVATSGTTCSVDIKQNTMRSLFIDKEPFDYEKSTAKMSPLFNSLFSFDEFSIEKDMKILPIKKIFISLIEQFPDNPHFHAHYGRFLSYVDNSPEHLDKAIEEAKLAVDLSEKTDCIVYNILANCQRNKMSQLIKQYKEIRSYNEVTQEQIDNLEDAILNLAEDASDNYSLSRTNGEAPGYICDIQMCIELVDFCRMLYKVDYIDIAKPKETENEYMAYYRNYYLAALTLYDEIDEIEHITERDTLQHGLQVLKEQTKVLKGELENTLQFWKNYLENTNNQKNDRIMAARYCIQSYVKYVDYLESKDAATIQYLITLSESLLNENVRIVDLKNWFNLNYQLSTIQNGKEDTTILESMFHHLRKWKDSVDNASLVEQFINMYLLIVSSIQALNFDSRASGYVKQYYSSNDKNIPKYYLKNNGRHLPSLSDVSRFNAQSANKDYLELEGIITSRGQENSYQIDAKGISVYFSMSKQEGISAHDVNKPVSFGLIYTLDGARALYGSVKRKKKLNFDFATLGCGSNIRCTLVCKYASGWIVSFDAFYDEYGYIEEFDAKKHSDYVEFKNNYKLDLVIIGEKEGGSERYISSLKRKKKCWKMS